MKSKLKICASICLTTCLFVSTLWAEVHHLIIYTDAGELMNFDVKPDDKGGVIFSRTLGKINQLSRLRLNWRQIISAPAESSVPFRIPSAFVTAEEVRTTVYQMRKLYEGDCHSGNCTREFIETETEGLIFEMILERRAHAFYQPPATQWVFLNKLDDSQAEKSQEMKILNGIISANLKYFTDSNFTTISIAKEALEEKAPSEKQSEKQPAK